MPEGHVTDGLQTPSFSLASHDSDVCALSSYCNLNIAFLRSWLDMLWNPSDSRSMMHCARYSAAEAIVRRGLIQDCVLHFSSLVILCRQSCLLHHENAMLAPLRSLKWL